MVWKKITTIISSILVLFTITGLLVLYYDLLGKITGMMGINQLLISSGYAGIVIAEILSSFILTIPYDVILLTGQWDVILIMFGTWAVIGIIVGLVTERALFAFVGCIIIMIALALFSIFLFTMLPQVGIPINLEDLIIGMSQRDVVMFFVTGIAENGFVAGTFGIITGSIASRSKKEDNLFGIKDDAKLEVIEF